MIRVLAVLMFTICSGGLLAQATLPIAGTLQAGDENLHLIEVDFGGAASTTNITLSISGNSATFGLQAFLGDLDAMAATSTGTDNGDVPDTTTINLTITSGNYTGVHQFIVSVQSFTGGGPVGYTGTLTVVSLPTGVSSAGTQTVPDAQFPRIRRYFDRAVNGSETVNTSGDTIAQEFLVDFGGVAQTATFAFFGEGSLAGNIDIIEVLANGSASALGSVSGAGADWSDGTNLTTSSRSGIVRFRVECNDADSDFDWTVILPGTVSAIQGAQLNFSGSLSADQERAYLVQLDYGANSTSYTLSIAAATSTGSVDVLLIDLNELAANGSSQAIGSFDASSVQLPVESGLFEFMVLVMEDGSSSATYDFTVEVPVAQSAFVQLGSKTLNEPQSFTNLFDRAVEADVSFSGAGTRTYEFNVDFGAVAHSAEVYLRGDGTGDGPIELFEVTSGGTNSLVASIAGMGGLDDEANGTTGVRTGVVKFRVVVTATGAQDFSFSVVFDDTVAVSLIKKKGDDKEDDGCSTGTGNTGWLALLGLLAALGAASRLRGARE